jgi:hypothetical protein
MEIYSHPPLRGAPRGTGGVQATQGAERAYPRSDLAEGQLGGMLPSDVSISLPLV